MENKTTSNKIYLITVLAFMLFLPILSFGVDYFRNDQEPIISLLGKWFVFWAIGVRLLTAGIKQAMDPAFTAEKIFHITDKSSFIIVKELGFANICFGLIGIISLFVPEWRMAAAFAGGLFLILDGITHIIKKPASTNETIAMVSDLFIGVIMAAYIIYMYK
ncbi:MAG TPA: DUF6790 family protein [Ferruginibacter sp.]|nr:DUF6790 family protein [Ferruginibacter sp.]